MKQVLAFGVNAGRRGAGGAFSALYSAAYAVFSGGGSIDDVSYYVYNFLTGQNVAVTEGVFAMGMQEVVRARMTWDSANVGDFGDAYALIYALSREDQDNVYQVVKDTAWRHFAEAANLESPDDYARGVSSHKVETLTASLHAERLWVIAYQRAYRDSGIVGFVNDRDAIEAGLRANFN